MRDALKALPADTRKVSSTHICGHLFNARSPLLDAEGSGHPPSLAIYAADDSEPDLVQLLDFPPLPTEATPEWLFPRVVGDSLDWHRITHRSELLPGAYDLFEPSPDAPSTAPGPHTWFLVPGRAFTRTGIRLGRGGGYYDRILESVPPARIIGVAFDLQIHPDLPAEDHDRPVGWLVTESGLTPTSCEAQLGT